MTKRTGSWSIFSAAVVALVLAATSLMSSAGSKQSKQDEAPFDEASIFLELNDTDHDLGIHALIDGDAYKRLRIEGPKGRMLEVQVEGRLRKQGLTELFFESAEPTFVELPPEEFFARFQEGEYEIRGVTLEGEKLKSEVMLSHVLPGPAGNITVSGVAAAENCDADPLPSVGQPVIIDWDDVTESHPTLGTLSDEIEVVKYQLVVEREEPETLVLSVDLPPDVTSFEVPQDFIDLDSGDGFKFEIVVREANGNQTAVESCFTLQ